MAFPKSKMSEWVTKKTVQQDHFFHPVPADSHWARGSQLNTEQNTPETVTDDSVPHDILQSFHPKEKEHYMKPLQHHTTVDLDYHGNGSKGNHRDAAPDVHQRHTGTLLVLPSPSTPLSSASSSSGSDEVRPDTFQTSGHDLVTPSRLLHASLLPSSRAVDRPVDSSSTSREDRFSMPRPSHGGVQDLPSSHLSCKALKPCFRLPSDTEKQSRTVPSSDSGGNLAATGDNFKRLSGTTHLAPASNIKSSELLEEDWISKMSTTKYAWGQKERQHPVEETESKKELLDETIDSSISDLERKLRTQMRLSEEEPDVREKQHIPKVPQAETLPELADAMQKEVSAALAHGRQSQVLSEGFRLQLTRADIATLRGLCWLNDQVVNFYMSLLMERGGREDFAKTYAFNTFFYPKLTQGGHSAVKRWTRKVDLFSHQYLVIPVHLGTHWCLCMVFMKEKKICYYDSMGKVNDKRCLNAVREYLGNESAEKRNMQLDLSEWSTEIVKDIPQQMNGSDCGVFACMYAEALTRGGNITFTQKDIPYFRRRMVYEILNKKLLR